MRSEQNGTNCDNFQVEAINAKLAQLLMEKPASTDQDLAEQLGVSRQTVNRRKNGPEVQKIIRDTLNIPEKEMRRLAVKALARLELMLDDKDSRIGLTAAVTLTRLSARFMGEMKLWLD